MWRSRSSRATPRIKSSRLTLHSCSRSNKRRSAMSPNKNSPPARGRVGGASPPPETMTWLKASFVLVFCVIFDLTRGFFSMFWLFGPALAAAYCTYGASDTVAAVKGGAVLSPALIMFGAVMAMALGILGWLTIGLILILKNSRIFKSNESAVFWFLLGFGVSELPFLSALPALTFMVGKLYRTQITVEKKQLKQWKKEQEVIAREERDQKIVDLTRARQERDAAETQFERQMEDEQEVEIAKEGLEQEREIQDSPEGMREAA